MARLARIDLQIRVNRLILANRFRLPELKPLFANRTSGGGLKIANRRFEAIRANRSHVVSRGSSANRFARITPIRVANRRAI